MTSNKISTQTFKLIKKYNKTTYWHPYQRSYAPPNIKASWARHKGWRSPTNQKGWDSGSDFLWEGLVNNVSHMHVVIIALSVSDTLVQGCRRMLDDHWVILSTRQNLLWLWSSIVCRIHHLRISDERFLHIFLIRGTSPNFERSSEFYLNIFWSICRRYLNISLELKS